MRHYATSVGKGSGKQLSATIGFTVAKGRAGSGFIASVGVLLTNPNAALAAAGVKTTVSLVDEAGTVIATDTATADYVPAAAIDWPVGGFLGFVGEMSTKPSKATVQLVVDTFTEKSRLDAVARPFGDGKKYQLEVKPAVGKGFLGTELKLQVHNTTDKLIDGARVECVTRGGGGGITGGGFTYLSDPMAPGATIAASVGALGFVDGQDVASGVCVVVA